MEKRKKKKHNENLRFVVMNEDTFKEKYSFSLNLRNIYILLSSIVVIFFLLMFLLISYTPIKHLVPGYGDIENNTYILKLNRYIDNLETQMKTQEQYNKSLRKIILGNDTSAMVNSEAKAKIDQEIPDTKNLKKNQVINISKERFDGLQFITPLSGKINKMIEVKSGHYGVDIAGVKDSPIKAAMRGVVIFSDWSTETGNTIIIQHPNGMISVYKHNSSLFKEIGDFVEGGEVIGVIGNTGTLTDGPHLHFELWKNGLPLDPLDFIDIQDK